MKKRALLLTLGLLFFSFQMTSVPAAAAPKSSDRIANSGEIKGTIVNSCGSVNSIEVYVSGRSFIARTDSTGAFILDYVQDGVFDVIIEPPGEDPHVIHNVQVFTDTITDLGTITVPDTRSDKNNCGACGTACGSGATCTAGACVCGSGTTNCAGKCVNTGTDPTNCGTCGAACASGQSCTAGACVCGSGTTNCAGRCVNTSTDPTNCGTCGTACPSGSTCSAGACVSSCTPPSRVCGTTCTNTATDTQNCGNCGVVCPALPNALPACSAGACGIAACSAGFADCDRITANGCETNINADAANCGACGRVCASGICSGGVCQ